MFVAPVPVCRCFMGLSFAAADAALFLEMVCCNVALARCLRFVGSMGPSSAAPAAAGWQRAANGVLDSVFAFCWFRSIGSVVPAAALFFEIVCCNIARPWCLCLVLVVPALPVFRCSMLPVVRAYDGMFYSVSHYMTTSTPNHHSHFGPSPTTLVPLLSTSARYLPRKVPLLRETYATVRSRQYEPLQPWRMACHVRAVDPAVPDWNLAPVHTPHHLPQ